MKEFKEIFIQSTLIFLALWMFLVALGFSLHSGFIITSKDGISDAILLVLGLSFAFSVALYSIINKKYYLLPLSLVLYPVYYYLFVFKHEYYWGYHNPLIPSLISTATCILMTVFFIYLVRNLRKEHSFERYQEKDQEAFDKFCGWFSKQDFRQRHLILNQLSDLHESLKEEKA